MKKIGLRREQVLKLLQHDNMSQNEFAQHVGITGGFMCQLLRGDRNPGPNVRQLIMDATGMTWDELFYEVPA